MTKQQINILLTLFIIALFTTSAGCVGGMFVMYPNIFDGFLENQSRISNINTNISPTPKPTLIVSLPTVIPTPTIDNRLADKIAQAFVDGKAVSWEQHFWLTIPYEGTPIKAILKDKSGKIWTIGAVMKKVDSSGETIYLEELAYYNIMTEELTYSPLAIDILRSFNRRIPGQVYMSIK